MTRPDIEDLDRLHGKASDVTVALRYPPTTRQWDALTACREIASSWPRVSEYIRALEQKNEELARKYSATQSAAGLAGNVSVDRNRKNQKLETALNVAVAAVIGLDAKCRSKGIDPGDYFETVRKLADAALGDTDE